MRGIHFLLSLFCFHAGSAQTWTQMPDFPGTARDDAASFSLNGSIFVGTGLDESFTLTNDWYRFDQATEQWSPIADLPATGRQYCASFVTGDFGYLFGGLDANGPLNELWRYDPLSDEWVQRAPLPAAGRYATIAFAVDQYGFVCTGMLDGGSATNETWRYDPASDTWSARSPVPGPARHRAAAMNGAYPIVVGGANDLFGALDDGFWYQAASDVWSPIAPLPEPRFGSDAAMGLFVGGASSLSEPHDDVWFYSYTDSWTEYPFPSFAGGPRRGGVIGVYPVADAGSWYYGTGLDSLDRHRDWWKIDMPAGIADVQLGLLSLFPNPGIDYFALTGLPSRPAHVTITDPQGRCVLALRGSADPRIDASSWSNGIYIVTAIDENGRTYHARWIKQ